MSENIDQLVEPIISKANMWLCDISFFLGLRRTIVDLLKLELSPELYKKYLTPIMPLILKDIDSKIKNNMAVFLAINDIKEFRKLGLSITDMVDILNKHKNIIMIKFLSKIKEDGIESIEKNINDLRDFNINWPELTIIEKSIKFEKNLTENNLYKWPASDIMDRLTPTQRLGLSQGIHSLRYEGLSNNIIVDSVKTYDKEIADWIDYIFTSLPSDSDNQVDQVITFIIMGANWPEFSKVINKHKGIIIKRLLVRIKNILSGSYPATKLVSIRDTIKYFRQSGFNWPEFSIIENSINIELNPLKNKTKEI